MMATVLTILAGAIALALGRFAYVRLRDFARANERRLHHAEYFYKAADVLVSDDETPREMLEFLEALNETISHRDAPRILMRYLLRGRQLLGSDESAKFHKVVTEFLERRTELQEPWHQAIANWFLTITYLSWWRGPMLRSAIHNQELIGAAKRVQRKTRDRDGNNVGHPQGERVPA